MAEYRTLVIVNPRAAGGRSGSRWPRVEAALRSTLGTFEHALTTRAGDATTYTRDALRAGYEMIVGIGGDGTFHEIANGFFDGEQALGDKPILGLIPSGTGGDTRRTWGVSKDPIEAIAALGGRATRPGDLGRIRLGDGTVRYFINIASFGVSADVSRRVNHGGKRLGGRVTFLLSSLRSTLSYTPRQVTLLTDGDSVKVVPALNVGAVAIGQYFGGGMRIAPKADPSDKAFDIVTVGGRSAWGMATMTSVYSGGHVDADGVSMWRGAVVEATSDSPEGCEIEADGELIGPLPARFEILPHAFRMKVAA